MELGIFAKTFQRATVEGVLDAVVHAGFGIVQFNFSCAGIPTLPERVEGKLIERIVRALRTRNLRIAAVSGTFNMIDPDSGRREEGLRRLVSLVEVCRELGAPVVTLCSGTRHAEDMWRGHPDNQGAGAWRDLIGALETVLPAAETNGVSLAIEPEHANVVNSAARAKQLLDEVRSRALGVVIDPANLLTPQTLDQQRGILSEAMDLVGSRLVLAHAKDLNASGNVQPAGEGLLDWEWYAGLLRVSGFAGAVIIHGVEESDAAGAGRFLRGVLERCAASERAANGA